MPKSYPQTHVPYKISAKLNQKDPQHEETNQPGPIPVSGPSCQGQLFFHQGDFEVKTLPAIPCPGLQKFYQLNVGKLQKLMGNIRPY